MNSRCAICGLKIATEAFEALGFRFHSNCFKCLKCKGKLNYENILCVDAGFYCQPCGEQVKKQKENEPEIKTNPNEVAAKQKQIASKISSTREEENCRECKKIVYPVDKLEVKIKEKREVFHKNCFRCHNCQILLNLNNYDSFQGIIYCQAHIKLANPTVPSSSYFLSPLKQSGNYVSSAPQDETTLSKEESDKLDLDEMRRKRNEEMERKEREFETKEILSKSNERRNHDSIQKRTPEEIAARQKEVASKVGSFRESENCKKCFKRVYLAEKLEVVLSAEKTIFHKSCFRCTTCSILLNLNNFESYNREPYCKVHIKEALPKSEEKYFISPLKKPDSSLNFSEPSSQYSEEKQNVDESSKRELERIYESNLTQNHEKVVFSSEIPKYEDKSSSNEQSKGVTVEKKEGQNNKIVTEEKSVSNEEDEAEKKREQRRKERELRKKQQEEEERLDEEKRKQRAEERRRKRELAQEN